MPNPSESQMPSTSQLPDDLDLLEEHRWRWWEIPQLIALVTLAIGGFVVIGAVLAVEDKIRSRKHDRRA